jgi:hypothetical protein
MHVAYALAPVLLALCAACATTRPTQGGAAVCDVLAAFNEHPPMFSDERQADDRDYQYWSNDRAPFECAGITYNRSHRARNVSVGTTDDGVFARVNLDYGDHGESCTFVRDNHRWRPERCWEDWDT